MNRPDYRLYIVHAFIPKALKHPRVIAIRFILSETANKTSEILPYFCPTLKSMA